MKKTLTAIALFTALGLTTGAKANLHVGHNEGLQNYYYYFGSNCCGSVIGNTGRPCPAPRPVAAPCDTCPPIAVRVEMEERCAPCPAPCDPCGGSSWGIMPWNW